MNDGARAPDAAASPPDGFSCRLARSARERAEYFALRRSIFCVEQGLFEGHDRDDCDDRAHPIVCLHGAGADAARVVGVVRIWEEAPGDWWGGRLGVDAQFRTVGAVGRRLVQTAVGTARAWGARRFRATVQRANVAFFRRLRWRTLEELDVLGHPHHLMEADLGWYLPTAETRPTAGRWRGRPDEGCDAA
jgi:putative N-acetyltransferase (TIGR04045 family)